MRIEDFEKLFAEHAERFGIAELARKGMAEGLQDMMISLSHIVSDSSSSWISVEDELPVEMKDVIVLWDGEVRIAKRGSKKDDLEDFYLGEGTMMYHKSYITHWMPLPEHPKTKK